MQPKEVPMVVQWRLALPMVESDRSLVTGLCDLHHPLLNSQFIPRRKEKGQRNNLSFTTVIDTFNSPLLIRLQNQNRPEYH